MLWRALRWVSTAVAGLVMLFAGLWATLVILFRLMPAPPVQEILAGGLLLLALAAIVCFVLRRWRIIALTWSPLLSRYTVGEAEADEGVGNRFTGPIGHYKVGTCGRVEVVAAGLPPCVEIRVAAPEKIAQLTIFPGPTALSLDPPTAAVANIEAEALTALSTAAAATPQEAAEIETAASAITPCQPAGAKLVIGE